MTTASCHSYEHHSSLLSVFCHPLRGYSLRHETSVLPDVLTFVLSSPRAPLTSILRRLPRIPYFAIYLTNQATRRNERHSTQVSQSWYLAVPTPFTLTSRSTHRSYILLVMQDRCFSSSRVRRVARSPFSRLPLLDENAIVIGLQALSLTTLRVSLRIFGSSYLLLSGAVR
jgi:hypothetical protein